MSCSNRWQGYTLRKLPYHLSSVSNQYHSNGTRDGFEWNDIDSCIGGIVDWDDWCIQKKHGIKLSW